MFFEFVCKHFAWLDRWTIGITHRYCGIEKLRPLVCIAIAHHRLCISPDLSHTIKQILKFCCITMSLWNLPYPSKIRVCQYLVAVSNDLQSLRITRIYNIALFIARTGKACELFRECPCCNKCIHLSFILCALIMEPIASYMIRDILSKPVGLINIPYASIVVCSASGGKILDSRNVVHIVRRCVCQTVLWCWIRRHIYGSADSVIIV